MRKKITKVLMLIGIVFSLFITLGVLSVSAAQISLDINSKELYDETNTFDYKFETTVLNGTKIVNGLDVDYGMDYRYDMVKRNGNLVSNTSPQITVFTHGWQGDADNWGYGENSLVRIIQHKTNAKIYTLSFDENYRDNHTLAIYDSTDRYLNQGKEVLVNTVDTTKHIILVFDGANTGYKHDYIYTQFNYALSRVVYEVKKKCNSVLPRIAMIGHSRGGLTNMQYALDHPDLVDSLYSFGTPYIGTSMAELDMYYCENSMMELINKEIAPGEQDLANPKVYGKLIERWNSNYEVFYSHIDVMALGGITSIQYLLEFVKGSFYKIIDGIPFMSDIKSKLIDTFGEEKGLELYISFRGVMIDLVKTLVKHIMSNPAVKAVVLGVIAGTLAIGTAALIICDIVDDILSLFIAREDRLLLNVLGHAFDIIQGGICLILNEVKINLFSDKSIITWESDFAVNIDSQMAARTVNGKYYEYKGFNRHYVEFKPGEIEANDITHNNEMFHKELQNYLLTRMFEGDDFAYTVLEDNTVAINGYYGAIPDGVLNIPSELKIDNKVYPVSTIADFAFSNNAYGKGIREVNIPSSVKVIGNNAFSDCTLLKSVDLSKATNLKKISSKAFAINNALDTNIGIESIKLPDNLQEIGSFAFLNNSNLESIELPSNLSRIDEGAFVGTNIGTIKGNKSFEWKNNVLVDKTGNAENRWEAIYANPSVSSITIPSNVVSISSSVFKNNKNIDTVDLTNVEVIGLDAFSNSTLRLIKNGNNVKKANYDAFAGTPWLDNNQDTEYLILGKTLLKYNGKDTRVTVKDGIERIGSDAFNDINIKEVILPLTIKSIGYEAFYDSLELDYVLIKASQPPILDGNCFNKDTKVFVQDIYLKTYKNNTYFKEIDNTITTLNVKLKFYDENKNLVKELSVPYGSSLGSKYPQLSKTGYDFVGYEDEFGNIITKGTILSYTLDTKLTAVFEKNVYIFNFEDLKQKVEVLYEPNAKVDVKIPSKNGYKFLGWYSQKDGKGKLIIDGSGKIVTWENVEMIYPKYEVINYKVTYDLSGVDVFGTLIYSYSVEDPLNEGDLPLTKKFGYIRDAWVIKGTNTKFTSTDKMYKDIVLTLTWKGTYTKTINTNITQECLILDMTNAANNTYDFKIGNTCDAITFIGDKSKTYTMSITVTSRDKAPLIIGFMDMNFMPIPSSTGSGTNAITADSDFKLFIMYRGSVSITGGKGLDGYTYSELGQAGANNSGAAGKNGGNGYSGGCGIYCSTVSFQEYDSNAKITVTGGAGGAGGKGQNGQKGGNGKNGPSGWFWGPKKGDDGRSGGIGGDGGVGGRGGYAVYSFANEVTVSSNLKYTFVGGAGGAGGAGGTGGAGGNGHSDTSANIFNGVGDPGNGGAGGKGGNGGAGGNGSAATNVNNVNGTSGLGGKYGLRGNGGAGGAGGDKGVIGSNGSSGGSGAKGAYGMDGKTGEVAYPTYQSSNAISDVPFLCYNNVVVKVN